VFLAWRRWVHRRDFEFECSVLGVEVCEEERV